MKRVLFLIAIAAIAFGSALSCSKEINAPEEENIAVEENVADGNENEDVIPKEVEELVTWTLKAGTEDTKVTPMNGANKFSWENNDVVKVLYDGGSTTCTASVSDGIATFSPSVPGGISTIYLVYPSDMTVSLDGDNLVVGMPSAQKNSLAGYFVARAEKTDEYALFKHPVCYYKFVVDGDGSDVTRLTLTAQSTDINATSVAIDFSDEEPAVSVSAGGTKTITYDFSGVGTYYIPFVPGETTVADNLTFQFYRSEARTEKAGAVLYGASLANTRGTIVDWSSLPAMATNRYVSTGGSDDNNGATVDKPWSFAKFKAFMENSTANGNTMRTEAALALYDGINIRFAEGTYSISSKIVPAIAIRTNLIGAGTSYLNAKSIFDGGSSNLLFDIYKNSGETISFKCFVIQNGGNSTDGGAIRIGSGSRVFNVSFDNCEFYGNSASTSGKNGGVLNVTGDKSSVSFKDCRFRNNSANNCGGVMSINGGTATFDWCHFKEVSGKKNTASNGGVLYLAGAVQVDLKDCDFQNNKATSGWGSCVYLNGTKGRLNVNRCYFSGNETTSRGVIASSSSDASNANLIYISDSYFTNNTVTTADGYGCVVHGNGYTTVCMNNVTTDNNRCTNASPSNNNWTLNLDGSWLIVNSTMIDKGYQHILRQNSSDTSVDVSLCNNIFIQVDGYQNYPIWVRTGGTITNNGHNVRSGASAGNAPSNTDKYSVSDLGGSIHCEWSGSKHYGVYEWSGSLASFTPATQTDVENTIKGFDHTAAGIQVGGTGAGSFYAWLSEIGALGKDGRGVTRSGSWWPGAYQN